MSAPAAAERPPFTCAAGHRVMIGALVGFDFPDSRTVTIAEVRDADIFCVMTCGAEIPDDTKRRIAALLAALPAEAEPITIQRCRRCGCTEEASCTPPCSWAEDELCTACVPPAPVALVCAICQHPEGGHDRFCPVLV